MHEGTAFGEALQRQRHAQRLTQAELAEKAGLSERAISDLERGLKHPQRATVRLLIDALGLTSAEAEQLELVGHAHAQTPERTVVKSPGKHNLPAPLTRFVGREQELMQVAERLASARLLTLTGVGGCGKTRLALELARDLVPKYADGVWLVELGPLADATLVARRVGSVVGVRESADQSMTTTLAAALAERQLLLVLDNCEHLLQACAELAAALLRACPHLWILATSREPLGIDGEVAWRVPSLAVPDAGRAVSVAEVERSPGVQLFVERAGAVRPHFQLTEHNRAAVVRICQRLDGIPLALELAAARVVALNPEQLVDRLDHSFRVLTGGSRVALPRQQTLQATLDWSYELLGEAERRLFEQLAVFAGDWTLEAAESVCVSESLLVEDVLDLVSQLVRKSLVTANEAADGSLCYRLLETVREYARQRLARRGPDEASAARERHAAFYSAELERLYPGMWRYGMVVWESSGLSADQLRERIEQMEDNLRVALDWLLTERRVTEGLRLAISLCQFWIWIGVYGEMRPWLGPMQHLVTASSDTPHAGAPAVPAELRARALSVLASAAGYRGDYAEGAAFYEECVSLSRECGDGAGLVRSLAALGSYLWLTGNRERAPDILDESVRLAREVADPESLNFVLLIVGQVARWQGHYEQATLLLSECLDRVGWPTRRRGYMVARALAALGRSAYWQGDTEAARTHLKDAIGVLQESRHAGQPLVESLAWLAAVAAAEGHLVQAARLFAAAEMQSQAVSWVLAPPDRQAQQGGIARVASQLGQHAFTVAWNEGHSMTRDGAMECALADAADGHDPTMG